MDKKRQVEVAKLPGDQGGSFRKNLRHSLVPKGKCGWAPADLNRRRRKNNVISAIMAFGQLFRAIDIQIVAPPRANNRATGLSGRAPMKSGWDGSGY